MNCPNCKSDKLSRITAPGRQVLFLWLITFPTWTALVMCLHDRFGRIGSASAFVIAILALVIISREMGERYRCTDCGARFGCSCK